MNLKEFERWYVATNLQRQRARYEEADREVNGDDKHYEELGRLVEEHLIVNPRIIGSRCD